VTEAVQTPPYNFRVPQQIASIPMRFISVATSLIIQKCEERAKRSQLDASSSRAPLSLPLGKLNAVRAAFKAGVTPSRIAREFGISQSDVRKALASDGSKA
jgi:hypothetical protein